MRLLWNTAGIEVISVGGDVGGSSAGGLGAGVDGAMVVGGCAA